MTYTNPFRGKPEGNQDRYPIHLQEVERAFTLLSDHDHVFEFRAKKQSKAMESLVVRGGDTAAASDTVTRLRRHPTIYCCLNPVLASSPLSASDEHIAYRRWLFFDVDAIRKGAVERECCSTAQEKEETRLICEGVIEYLSGFGWPEPLVIDSGNGFYALYRIHQDNDEPTRELIRSVTHAIADEFPGAKIDRTVFNASRLARMPGTWNRKGSNTIERPHRLARIVRVPDKIELVTREQLVAVAGEQVPAVAPGKKAGKQAPRTPFRGAPDQKRKQAYVRAILRNVAADLAVAIPGDEGGEGRNVTLNNAAFAVGRYLDEAGIESQEVIDALVESSHACNLVADDGIEQVMKTIQSGLSGGRKKARPIPPSKEELARQGQSPIEQGTVTETEKADRPIWQFDIDGEIIAEGEPEDVVARHGGSLDDGNGSVRRFSLCTMGNLARIEFPPPVWVIPDIMSEGLNILAGAPKAGKSVLALNLALTVAGGGLALGGIKVQPSDVLYLSLEDQLRRVRARAVKMLQKIDPELSGVANDRLIIATDWPRQDEGGLQLVEMWSRRVPKPGLLIIDVWNRFSPQYKHSGSTYTQDAQFMSDVKKFAEKRGFSALIVHHTRKQAPGVGGADFLAEVSGTMGLTGTADGVIVLARSRQEKTAVLNITGRDVSEKELVLEFTEATLTWRSLGTKDQFVEGDVQTKVLEYLKKITPGCAHNSVLAEELKLNDDSVRKATRRMAEKGIIQRRGNAYAWPGMPVDEVAL